MCTACRGASLSPRTALTSTPGQQRIVKGGSFSRTGRGQSGWTEGGPGPGAYQRVEQASAGTLPSRPAYTFGSGRDGRTCRLLCCACSSAACNHVVALQLWRYLYQQASSPCRHCGDIFKSPGAKVRNCHSIVHVCFSLSGLLRYGCESLACMHLTRPEDISGPCQGWVGIRVAQGCHPLAA